jgi:hypothetical protein
VTTDPPEAKAQLRGGLRVVPFLSGDNFNAAVALALPKLLVELGVFESCGVIILQLHHSKEISDRYFGLI